MTMRFYDFEKSGHAHRARLMASLLNVPFELQSVDLAGGEHLTKDYLAINPFGQVPVLVDGDDVVWDSTAILIYLAKKYGDDSWLPSAPNEAASVQRYLSIASNEVFRGPCCARLVTVFGADFDHKRALAVCDDLFTMLEAHLTDNAWLAAPHRTIADVALYSYIAHAPEGGADLHPFPMIRSWLERVEALPGFIAMPKTVAGLVSEI